LPADRPSAAGKKKSEDLNPSNRGAVGVQELE